MTENDVLLILGLFMLATVVGFIRAALKDAAASR